jgi:hypothetical protein
MQKVVEMVVNSMMGRVTFQLHQPVVWGRSRLLFSAKLTTCISLARDWLFQSDACESAYLTTPYTLGSDQDKCRRTMLSSEPDDEVELATLRLRILCSTNLTPPYYVWSHTPSALDQCLLAML